MVCRHYVAVYIGFGTLEQLVVAIYIVANCLLVSTGANAMHVSDSLATIAMRLNRFLFGGSLVM